MAVHAGPEIVEDGLVLCLDAANTRSYPGSGTAWNDLSGNGNNGTLVNGVTYINNNGDLFNFDGSNDYFEISDRNTNLEFQPTQPFSVFCWVYNLTAGSGAIISNMQTGTGYPGWDLWRNGTNSIAMHLITSWSTNAVKVKIDFNYTANANKWMHLGYTYNGSCPTNSTSSVNSVNFYINGNLYSTGKSIDNADGFNTSTETITYNSLQKLRIASRWSSGGISEGGPVLLSNVSIYNTELNSSQIQQNFQATRDRYGI